MSILPILFVLATLAIYLMVALRKGKGTITADEFSESRGLISPSGFATSSVAYGFRIAPVIVSFASGYFCGLGGIVNPVFWGLGIILFMLVCGRLGDFFDTTPTLHGFLGSMASRSTTSTTTGWSASAARCACGSSAGPRTLPEETRRSGLPC